MELLDYVEWRGDLDFDSSPLNPVDALIFCQLSYLNFDGILQKDFSSSVTLNQCASMFAADNFESRRDLGLLINPKTVDLLFACASSVRFGKLLLSGYVNKYSPIHEEQFSALTFFYKSKNKKSSFAFVSFRGTDDTIIGWKEDFNLAFKENIPAQKDALSYLTESSANFKKATVYCGGHSKGGNLAIYAGAFLNKKYQPNLKTIYNFDGPGFLKETLEKDEFKSALKKTESFFPQGSIVGMIFEHDKNYSVVKSDGVLMMQHDAFTWKTSPQNFELMEELEKSSLFFNETFNQWFVQLPEHRREEFVETLFGVLESTQAETNSQLAENWIKNGGKIIKAFAKLDKEIRNSALDTASQFIRLARHKIPELF